MRQKVLVLAGLTAVAFGVSGLPAPTTLVSDAGAVSAKPHPRCLGRPATIVGTKAAETIHGTAGDDVIVGGGGDDHIFGMGGADRICDRTGEFSHVYGGSGTDRIAAGGVMGGGPGDDVLLAPPISVPFMHGGKGDDLMRSRAKTVALFDPGPGDDTVESRPATLDSIADFRTAEHGVVVNLHRGTADGEGHDVLRGINYVYGSKHDDVLLGDAHSNQILGNQGNDVIAGRGQEDGLEGGPGDDRIEGGAGHDFVAGGAGRDTLLGRAGPDVMAGEAGRDTLRGGVGNDNLIEQKPEVNLIVGGPGRRDRCYGGYKVPPNVERGCEFHRPPPRHPRQFTINASTRRRLVEHLNANSTIVRTPTGQSVRSRPSCHIRLGS